MLQERVVPPNWTFQGWVEIMLPAGVKGKGRQKAKEDPEGLDMHLLIWDWGWNGGWKWSRECIHPASQKD